MDTSDGGNRLFQFTSMVCEKGLVYEKLMLSARLESVSRWHFRMVNDYERNMAYYKSLLSFSSEKPVKVLDIGTGSGLLSLFASYSPNVREIYAVESEVVLAEIAKNVFKDNYIKNVCVINNTSNKLNAGDINGRADLAVTEIFDAALFGEHSLMTLHHAWKELLHENAKIIPCSADLFVTGIESEFLAKWFRVVEKNSLIKDTTIISMREEPYDAENLKAVKWKAITETTKILTVNFCCPDQLKSLLDGEKIPVNLKCISNGQIDAFAIWFNLHLDESITITTDPRVDNVRCWEQAVFSIDFPPYLQKEEEVNLNFSSPNNCVTLEIMNNTATPKYLEVNREVITFLNDTLIIPTMEKLAKMYDGLPKKVLDYSEFPLFGLLLAKNGGMCNYIFQNANISSLINHVLDVHDIPPDRIKTLHYLDCQNLDFGEFDIILFDVIGLNGTLSSEAYNLLWKCTSSLVPQRQIFPRSITLVCEIIESDYLSYCSRANDDNSFAFKIANHLNKFAIEEQWIVDKKLPHRKLTNRLELEILRDDSEPLLSEHYLPVIQKGKTDGVLYWFELSYGEDLKISTFESSHYNVSCFLLHKNDWVYENNYVKLSVKQHCGFLKIFFNC